jgi:hypothetical protein
VRRPAHASSRNAPYVGSPALQAAYKFDLLFPIGG